MKINITFPFAKQVSMRCFRQAWQSLQYKRMLFLSILPLCCTILLWAVILTSSIMHFDWFLHQFPSMWINYASNDGFLPKISYYLLIFFATIIMLLCCVILVGICMSIINAFLAPLVVQFVHKTYYPYIKITPPNFTQSLYLSALLFIKTLFQFVVFLLCCYLLSFIGLGFIGLLLGVFIYFQFYCKNLNHDVGISIMSQELYKLFLQTNKWPLTFVNILIFIPLYIPVINCFIATWQILVLAHYMFAWYSQYGNIEGSTYIEEAIIVE
ncbi:EI24 domain-containing protein [Helicobacter trogontum]|uniref:EI24 domain-containing protein n=2 Tax=Helicobacter trogontum TaxID=50960 RepID=A0A4U8TD49_9HELI|nr:EI24 domain-containing protein [Helicobacter trogontum]MDY5184705.1 EI24 domain-containing protein [Helicobacter trogontum]TLD97905.1 hypothetical protein LS80_006670 [Helicobacter trogontum]